MRKCKRNLKRIPDDLAFFKAKVDKLDQGLAKIPVESMKQKNNDLDAAIAKIR